MMTRAAVAVLALSSTLFCSAHVHAATPPPPIAPEARADYEMARAKFKAGDYKGCVEALERAQKVSPDPRLFWNSAACEKKLGHHAKAIRFVERYLTAGASSLTDHEKREANAFLEAAAAYVAKVTIVANVDGVEVFVDGDLVGTTPLAREIVVDEGDHAVRYVRSGYRTVDASEKALPGATLRWAVDMTAASSASSSSSSSTSTTPPTTTNTTGTQPTDKRGSSSKPSRIGPIALGSAGIVVAGIGTTLVVTTLGDASDLESECGTACPPSRWEGARDRQIVGDVLLVAGGAMLAGAAVWWLLQSSSSSSSSSTSSPSASVGWSKWARGRF